MRTDQRCRSYNRPFKMISYTPPFWKLWRSNCHYLPWTTVRYHGLPIYSVNIWGIDCPLQKSPNYYLSQMATKPLPWLTSATMYNIGQSRQGAICMQVQGRPFPFPNACSAGAQQATYSVSSSHISQGNNRKEAEIDHPERNIICDISRARFGTAVKEVIASYTPPWSIKRSSAWEQ